MPPPPDFFQFRKRLSFADIWTAGATQLPCIGLTETPRTISLGAQICVSSAPKLRERKTLVSPDPGVGMVKKGGNGKRFLPVAGYYKRVQFLARRSARMWVRCPKWPRLVQIKTKNAPLSHYNDLEGSHIKVKDAKIAKIGRNRSFGLILS